MKSAEFSCGRLGFGMEKYIKQKKKEKNTENIKKEVGMGEGVVGHGPQTILSGAKDSADDCLAMKCGISGADGRLVMRKSPKRKKKKKIQKQKRKENENENTSTKTSAAYVHHFAPVRWNIGSQRLRANARKKKRLLVPMGMYTSIAPTSNMICKVLTHFCSPIHPGLSLNLLFVIYTSPFQ